MGYLLDQYVLTVGNTRGDPVDDLDVDNIREKPFDRQIIEYCISPVFLPCLQRSLTDAGKRPDRTPVKEP